MTRRISIMFVFLLVMQTMLSGLNLHTSSAEGKKGGSLELSIASVKDEDGEDVDLNGEYDEDIRVNIAVGWEVDGIIKEGTKKTLKLSNQLIVENQSGTIVDEQGLLVEEEEQDESSADELVIGQYSIENGELLVEIIRDVNKPLQGQLNFDGVLEANNDKAIQSIGLLTSSGTISALSNGVAISDNIIDEIKLKREDGSEYEDGDQLDPNEDLELGLEWSLPNGHGYTNGSTFEFDLPKQLNIYSEIAGDLDEYGSFVVTADGHVTFTFNEKIESDSNIEGTFWVKTELDKQKITSSTEEIEIKINDDISKKITINIKPEGGQTIHKEGQPVGGTFNTDEIEWTVLINTTKDALENAIITDPIGDGQELDLDSIELKEIEVNLAGEKIDDLGLVDLTNVDKSTVKELKLELGDTSKAYELTFKTKMEESEKDREGWLWYSNTAYLNSDGKDEKESGTGVSVQRPESLTKSSSSFDKENRSVEWEVNANFTEKSLKEGDEIVDEFTFTIGKDDRTDAFEIKNEDIEIFQVDSFTDDGKADSTSDAKDLFDISIDDNKVTYKLKEDTNKAFIIKYKTKAKDGAYIDNDGNISNTVEIDGKTKTSEQHVGQQVGVKGNKGIDYENKTIDWEITINADKQDLRNFILTDDFSGSGQQLVDGSIEIDPSISNDQITPNDDGEGFVIDFGDITETYTITYQTEFIYDFEGEKTPNFHNNVDITYKTNDGTDYELEIENGVDPNNNTKNNGVKNGTANNETKEITWTVDVNYNNLTLTDAKVIDEIADNQSLIDGSVKVYETSIDSDGNITTGDDVTENFDVTAEENLVEVLFEGEIKQSHRVEFKTKDKDDIYNSDEVYENTAQFIPREGEEHNLKATVTLPNQGEFLGKSGLHNKNDWTVDWTIDVNQSQSKLTGVTVKDDLGDDGSQILLEDSFKVTKAGSDEELDEDAYELTIDGNAFSIKFDGEITDAYEITYSSYILAGETADLKNEAEIESVENEIVGNVEKEEVVEVKISTGGGTAEGATGGLTLEKTEKDTNRPLKDVKFTLLTTIGGQEIIVREGKTGEEGKLEWTGLRYGNYTLIEELPEGYTGVETQEVTINNDSLEDGVLTLKDEIVNERQTGTAKIVKVDAVTGDELDGAKFKMTNQTTNQTYTFTTKDGGEISEDVPFGEYTVEEVTAPNGYRVTEGIDNIIVEIDETAEITVTNEAIVEIAGEKQWFVDDNQELPSEITVELLAGDTKQDETKVTAENNWKYSFTNLDKYDAEGNEIEYSIEEVELDGYVSEKDGYDLTNIQMIDISGEKTWVEVDEQHRPDSITVSLFANEDEEAVETVEVSAETDWTFEFTNLPKYDSEGNEIEYTIEEVDVTGYTSEIKDFNITNTQETTELSGTKTWIDNDDATGDRPESITVQVLNGDEVVQEQDVSANDDGEWNYTFTDLPTHDKDGNEIEYTVAEKDVPEGYEATVDGNYITNLRVGTIDISGEKNWVEVDEQYRPDSIIVNLLANGEEINSQEVTVNEKDEWIFEFTDLQEFDTEGKAIEYTIEEEMVAGYTTEIEDFTITNTQETTELSGIKTWIDNDDATGDRPKSITVQVLNRDEVVQEQDVSANDDGQWLYTFTDLPMYDKEGNEIVYTVNELPVPGYTTDYDENNIINTRAEILDIVGTKSWNEADEQQRPDSIKVQLIANGEVISEQTVTAESNWEYKFEELSGYNEEGTAIAYEVKEIPIPGYITEINGYDITNTQLTKDLTVNKIWKEDYEEIRPKSIQIDLLADGVKVDTIKITEKMDWTFTFEQLPIYNKNSEEIEYSIEEHAIKEYGASITETEEGFEITNTLKEEYALDSALVGKDEDGQKVPKTATPYYNMLLIGILIMAFGALIFVWYRSRRHA